MSEALAIEQQAALLLKEAAAAAGKQVTIRKAIHCAWGWLHRQGPEVMAVAFRLWCNAEGHTGWAGYLADVLRRRYRFPSDISRSLEAASKAALHGGSGE